LRERERERETRAEIDMKNEKKDKKKKSGSKNKKVYSRDDVIYHIEGVETCIIEVSNDDDEEETLSLPQSLAVDADMYVVVLNEQKNELQLAIRAGSVTCPLSVGLPVLRRNYGARLAYMFPLVLDVEDDGSGTTSEEEEELVSFTVILPEVYTASSPIVLGFEDLLHKFALFEVLKEDSPAGTDKGATNGSDSGATNNAEKEEFVFEESFDPSENTDWIGTIVFRLNEGEVSLVQMIFEQEVEGEEASAGGEEEGLRILQPPTKGVISVVFYASPQEPIQRALVLETILGTCVLHSKVSLYPLFGQSIGNSSLTSI